MAGRKVSIFLIFSLKFMRFSRWLSRSASFSGLIYVFHSDGRGRRNRRYVDKVGEQRTFQNR
jgi:hypothetical protein